MIWISAGHGSELHKDRIQHWHGDWLQWAVKENLSVATNPWTMAECFYSLFIASFIYVLPYNMRFFHIFFSLT